MSPAIISIAPLKFPKFQHSLATLNRQDNIAFRSSCVGRVIMRCVVHELTWTHKKHNVNIAKCRKDGSFFLLNEKSIIIICVNVEFAPENLYSYDRKLIEFKRQSQQISLIIYNMCVCVCISKSLTALNLSMSFLTDVLHTFAPSWSSVTCRKKSMGGTS